MDSYAEWPAWYRPTGYVHFDQWIRDPELYRRKLESPAHIARHAFLPFLHFEKIVRKYKREHAGFVKKIRPLSYASHADALVLRYYSLLLNPLYEQAISDAKLTDCVSAYRKFETPKCNVHFALDAFRYIESRSECTALAFDIQDFFESLSHTLIKQQWKQLVGKPSLPDDHYAVFKAVTKYAWVDRKAAMEALGISKRQLTSMRTPLCTPIQFREVIRPLIKVRREGRGIPQGSPISALLSNVYMFGVDSQLAKLAFGIGGFYRRYSDDLLFIAPTPLAKSVESAVREEVAAVGLKIHDGDGKLCICNFRKDSTGRLSADRPLQYLGLTFDGVRTAIRSHSVAKYVRKMKKAVRREIQLARRLGGITVRPRRKVVYENYTHLGKQNFVAYAKRVELIAAGASMPRRVKRHWKFVHDLLDKI